MDTIALQIENKAPLEDVAKLLSDLKTNLEKQQSDSDDEHEKQEHHVPEHEKRDNEKDTPWEVLEIRLISVSSTSTGNQNT